MSGPSGPLRPASSNSRLPSHTPEIPDLPINPTDFFARLTEFKDRVAGPSLSDTQSRKKEKKSRLPTSSSFMQIPGPSHLSNLPTTQRIPNSSQSNPSRTSIPQRSFTNRPTLDVSEAIDLTENRGNRNKGKAKAIEPIDLTLTDTDEEAPVATKKKQSVLGSNSSGSIIILDNNMQPETVSSKDGSRLKGKSRIEIDPKRTTPGYFSSQAGPSRIKTINPTSDISPRKFPSTQISNRARPSIGSLPRRPLLTPSSYNSKGLSSGEAIDLCSNSSGSSPPNSTLPLIAPTSIKKSLSQRELSRSGSSNSLTFSTSGMSPSQKPSLQHRMNSQQLDAALAEQRRNNEKRGETRNELSESQNVMKSGRTLGRSISRESLGLGLSLNTPNRIQGKSPLKNVVPLPNPQLPSDQTTKETATPQNSAKAKDRLPGFASYLNASDRSPWLQSSSQQVPYSSSKKSTRQRSSIEKHPSSTKSATAQSSVKSIFAPRNDPTSSSNTSTPTPALSPKKQSKLNLSATSQRQRRSGSSASAINRSVGRSDNADSSEDEDEQSYRPKSAHRHSSKQKSSPEPHTRTSSRSRPEPGAYKLPEMDTNIHDWPRTESTHSAGGSMRKALAKGKEKEKGLDISTENDSNHDQQPNKPKVKEKSKTKQNRPTQQILDSQLRSSRPIGATSNTTTKVSPHKKPVSPIKRTNAPTNRPSTPNTTNMSRTSTNSSALTSLPSQTPTPQKNRNNGYSKEGYKPSPVKSLSASPVKGKPFQRLVGTETPIPKTTSNEDRPPQVDVENEIIADDIFAEFEDFQWAASDDEGSNQEDVPQEETSEAADSNEADQNGKSKETTSTSNDAQLPEPTTPRSSQKRSNPAVSPTSSHKRRAMVERYDQMEKDEQLRLAEEKKEEEERERQLESGFKNLLENQEEHEDEGGDLAGFLDDIASKPTPKEKPPSPVKPDMASAVHSRAESRKAKEEAAKLARQRAKVEANRKVALAERMKKAKGENREFDKLMKEMESGKDFEDALKEISANNNKNKRDQDAYPTPETELDLEDDHMDLDMDFDMNADVSLQNDGLGLDIHLDELEHIGNKTLTTTNIDHFDSLVDSIRKEGLQLDDSLIKDAKAGLMNKKNKHKQGLDWEGFWNNDSPKPGTAHFQKIIPFNLVGEDPISIMINDITKQSDLDELALVFTSGAVSFIQNGKRELGVALIKNAILSSEKSWAWTALNSFSNILQDDEYFSIDDINSFRCIALQLLHDLGGRKSILALLPELMESSTPELPSDITTAREACCALILVILNALLRLTSKPEVPLDLQSEESLKTSVLSWIRILMLLSIDNSATSALRRTISETIQAIFDYTFSRTENLNKYAATVAHFIAKSTAEYDASVHVALLQSIIQANDEIGKVKRWLAMEYLLPGTLDKVIKMDKFPPVPPVEYLMKSIERIFDLINPPNRDQLPDYDEIDRLITFLYASMSDMDTLVEEQNIDFDKPDNLIMDDKSMKDLMGDCEIEKIREGLRRCRDKIPEQSDGSYRSTVKARLHQLHEITRLTLTLSIKKRIRAKKLGKGLKIGPKGQTKLDFSSSSSKHNERGIQMEKSNSNISSSSNKSNNPNNGKNSTENLLDKEESEDWIGKGESEDVERMLA